MIDIIKEADVIVITAGAGMGVDSGLPDFRGNEGMWKAYPALGDKKIPFSSIANPDAFEKNPDMAWAFYGHRYDLYKKTSPHMGYHAIVEMAKQKQDYFVVTSNVDGAFQKAGVPENKMYEIHGRINKFQCTKCDNVWKPNDSIKFDVDPSELECACELPKCSSCGAMARPNIMMFGDYGFNATETKAQEAAFNNFMHKYDKGKHKIAVVEFGAGTAIPSIRMMGEYIHNNVEGATLVRVNPRETEAPKGSVVIAKGAMEASKEMISDEIKDMFFMEP
jgi:NAD-dependent SIR2 family protein deacetylase